MTWTAYCMKHETLEEVDEVLDRRTWAEEELRPTGAKAYEIHAKTEAGCKVNFIGGPQWR